ncbi:MAG TPA: glycine betaine ABC transporter substrate-binding protein [Thermoleophilaceae bacterium]|nr:glycine betaine ABC transporter substrate-binding protein [Thermoleophilaceae bacterium]
MTRSLRLILAALAAVLLALAVGACGSDDEDEGGGGGGGTAAENEVIEKSSANAGKSVTVGSKNFTEQFILGEIYSQALQAAGFKVKKELNLGSEQIAYKALKAGQIDGYPEYTGTSLTSFFDVKTKDVPRDPDQAYALAKRNYAKEGITALPRTAFENKYVVTTTKAKQKDLLKGAKTLSEVAKLPNADKLRIAGFPECRQRSDCFQGLRQLYGFDPKFISTTGKYEPLDGDQTDLNLGSFSTDGQLTLNKYAVLEDDKKLFPPYNISFGIRDQALRTIGPEGRAVLERVQKPLTLEAMQELNSRVDLDKQKPAAVAAAYLREEGFTK